MAADGITVTAEQNEVVDFSDPYIIAGERFSSKELGFVFQPGSDLIEPTNVAIAALKADGTWDELCIKWFIEYKP